MPSTCPPGKILNPKTNRCVLLTGKIGQEIVKQQEKEKGKGKTEGKEKTTKTTKTTKTKKTEGPKKSPITYTSVKTVQEIVKPADISHFFVNQHVKVAQSTKVLIANLVNRAFNKMVVRFNFYKLTNFREFLEPLFASKDYEAKQFAIQLFDNRDQEKEKEFKQFPKVRGVPESFECNRVLNIFLKAMANELVSALDSPSVSSTISDSTFHLMMEYNHFFRMIHEMYIQ